jgi:hypothetical protein
MNEFFKVRYNLSKYFLNVDNNIYEYLLTIIIPLLYLIPALLLGIPFLFIKSYNDIINITTFIYIFMIIVLIGVTYKLINSLKDIQTNPIINSYHEYYKLANIIYRENYANSKKYVQTEIKEKLLKNIGNIENLYGEQARRLLNTTTDLLQYDDSINKKFVTRLYFDNYKNFKYLLNNNYYVFKETPYTNYEVTFIDLNIMEEYNKDKEIKEKKLLLNYLNQKYNTNLKTLYIPSIFTGNFNKKFKKMVDDFKYSIYFYFSIISYFIIILFQGILLNYY